MIKLYYLHHPPAYMKSESRLYIGDTNNDKFYEVGTSLTKEQTIMRLAYYASKKIPHLKESILLALGADPIAFDSVVSPN